MSNPLVVDYLRTHSNDELLAEHGVDVSIGTRPYKAALNYNQIEAKESDRLACECRGLILATHDGRPWPEKGAVGEVEVFARPMDRFFNHGTGSAHQLDLEHPDTRVLEKLDGTLTSLYLDLISREWCVATRSVPDADKPIDGFGEHTFRTLFEEALKTHKLSFNELTSHLSSLFTYCFELTAPHNHVVVKYDRPSLHLLAVRNIETGAELCPTSVLVSTLIPPVPAHPVRTLSDLLALVESRPASQGEGVVVRMPGFKRVKVKSAAYLAAHRLKSSVGNSPRSLLSVILMGQYDDVEPLLPEYMKEHGQKIREGMAALARKYDEAHARLWTEVTSETSDNPRKAYALAVQRDGLMIGPLMERYTGRAKSFMDWVANQRDPVHGWSDSWLDTLLAKIGG